MRPLRKAWFSEGRVAQHLLKSAAPHPMSLYIVEVGRVKHLSLPHTIQVVTDFTLNEGVLHLLIKLLTASQS